MSVRDTTEVPPIQEVSHTYVDMLGRLYEDSCAQVQSCLGSCDCRGHVTASLPVEGERRASLGA